jgi:hypothetical protein
MNARFLTALFATFIGIVATLGAAGYAVTRLTGVLALASPPRELFRGPAFDFELSPGWWCELEDSTYTCSPPGKPPFAAIVVMAMKVRNDDDNLRSYEALLSKPKPDTNGPVQYVKRRTLGAHEWVEALHHGSELKNYDTYYLATNTSYLGIVVTMSVEKNEADKYITQLNDMMRTLRVYQR